MHINSTMQIFSGITMLCIIESKKVMTYAFFIECLKSYKVDNAL